MRVLALATRGPRCASQGFNTKQSYLPTGVLKFLPAFQVRRTFQKIGKPSGMPVISWRNAVGSRAIPSG